VTRVPVGFRGAGSGSGELTWGQREIWRTMRRTGRTPNIAGFVDDGRGPPPSPGPAPGPAPGAA
jgi:hypothetical protein